MPDDWEPEMTERDYTIKLDELERLLNDPTVQMDPNRVWSLLAEISAYDAMRGQGNMASRI